MSLTKDDLKAVKQLIDSSIDDRMPPMLDKLEDRTFKRLTRLESRLLSRIDEVDDAMAIQTENGLQEVRDQVSGVRQTVGRIERAQQVHTKRDKLKRTSRIA